MTFQVYYRKWRPQRFHDLVGQEHVSSTLNQAVQQGRVAHSYLFCGPRGTGKTSTARVLAKAVNCLSTEESDACNLCAHCLAINEARYLDLIELDAASNRGIDEIRNIRDKVNLAPAEDGYKVYIIDEAHMLTEHASNAFLKTLEEPPPHAIFVLCTTEPHKIPPTIISRCQRFDFRRLAAEAVIGRLREICQEEGVGIDGEALATLARWAGGSLRDAENLLEQLVVSYGDQIGTVQVNELLGLGQSETALEFARYLLLGNAAAALGVINQGAWDGADLRQLHSQSVELLRGALLIHYGARESVNLPQETVKDLEELVPRSSLPRLVRALKLLGEVNMKYDASSPLPLELAVVEACMDTAPEQPQPGPAPMASPPPQPRPQPRTADRAVAPPRQAPDRPTPPVRAVPQDAPGSLEQTRRPEPPTPVRAAGTTESSDTAAAPREAIPADPAPVGSLQEQWSVLVRHLSRYKGKRFNFGALLRDCKSQQVEGETLVLTFSHRSHLERMQEELDDPQGMKTVNEALLKALGSTYQLKLALAGDNGSSRALTTGQSPLVRAALSMGARILEERNNDEQADEAPGPEDAGEAAAGQAVPSNPAAHGDAPEGSG